MTRLPVVVLALIVVAACSHPRDAERAPMDVVSIPAPSLAGSVIANAERQPALVLVPPSYAGSQRTYPVIYFLPGFTTDVGEYVDGSINGLDLRRVLAAAWARDPSSESIVVVANGRNALGGSFYVDSPVTGRWGTHLVADVVAWVDAHYRTRRDRSARVIAGEGMGGFGALKLALHHPDVFGAVYALSPELFDAQGLDDSGLLTRPALRTAYALDLERMRGWPAGDGPQRMARLVADMLAADSRRFNHSRAMVYAYGAAFAPAPDAGPPFLAHDDRTAWDAGYGAWPATVERHRAALQSLRGVGIAIGGHDNWAWEPRGARALVALLRDAGVNPEFHEDDGNRYDRLERRISDGLLPFCARLLRDGAPR